MYPGRYFIPNYIPPYSIPIRNVGMFQRLFNGIRQVNWKELLNNTNKTLNVVNQTIPLVRQAGPMINNLKSMLRIAKAFNNETTIKKETNKEPNILNKSVNNTSPNFFL